MGVNNKMKTLEIEHQKGTSVLKTAFRILYHRSDVKELIADISSLIDKEVIFYLVILY